MIEKLGSDVLTLIIRCLNFYESTCDLTDVTASIYDRTMDAPPFDITHDILRCLSFVQSLLKYLDPPIWRIGNLQVKLRPPPWRRRVYQLKSKKKVALNEPTIGAGRTVNPLNYRSH